MAFNSNDISQYFVRINWGLSSKHKRNTILKVVTDSVHLFLEMTSRVCWISRSQGSTQTVGRGWRRRASHTTPSYWWIITVIFFSFFSSFNLENIFIRYWWRVTCSVAKTVTNFPLNFLTFFILYFLLLILPVIDRDYEYIYMAPYIIFVFLWILKL